MDEARLRARQFLRKHTSFVWNATNLSRHIRDQLISLFATYNARIRIVYAEGTADVIARRNQKRKNPVPAKIIKKLLAKWTVPNVVEAHAVEAVLSG